MPQLSNRMSRRSSIAATALALLTIAIATPAARADEYPSRPIHLIVPFPPGGGSDFVARLIAQKLGESLGQTVIVENKPGAGGNLGVSQGVRAAADGYTLMLIASTYTVNPAIYDLGYDPIKDITPIVQVSQGPLVLLVNADLGVQTVQDLIALAKKKPDGLLYASAGKGSITHAAAVLFAEKAGLKMTHVPYKGTAPALTDTIAGRTQLIFSSPESALPFMQSGQLKALGVTTAGPIKAFPGVPPIGEAGVPGYEVDLWYGLIAPAGLPRAIVDKLNKAANDALALKDTADKFVAFGHEPTGGTPEKLQAIIGREIGLWSKVGASGVFKGD